MNEHKEKQPPVDIFAGVRLLAEAECNRHRSAIDLSSRQMAAEEQRILIMARALELEAEAKVKASQEKDAHNPTP